MPTLSQAGGLTLLLPLFCFGCKDSVYDPDASSEILMLPPALGKNKQAKSSSHVGHTLCLRGDRSNFSSTVYLCFFAYCR